MARGARQAGVVAGAGAVVALGVLVLRLLELRTIFGVLGRRAAPVRRA
ncbi:hypothetical protein [Pseudonocardia lacus]|nr:hypothetical protein [Pseudonocardia lacus]